MERISLLETNNASTMDAILNNASTMELYTVTVQQIDKPAELQYNNQSSKDKFTKEFI